MPSERTFTIVPRGPFSLRESALFGFGQRQAAAFDGTMRLAFCPDDFGAQVAVALRQDEAGVHGTVQGSADVAAVERQVARVLSLADDATGFMEVGQRDPVMARLQAAAPGLRPPLFYSAYEAAAWCVLSQRRPAAQMMEVRRRLSAAHGATFVVAGQELAALPTPAQMLAVDAFPGLPEVKLQRLHGVARAALEGQLDTDAIRETDPVEAMAALQAIPGIGPFSSALIVVRAVGVRDVLPPDEPRGRRAAQAAYGLKTIPTVEEFAQLAAPWRPWRTWCTVLVRAASARLSG